ncbi:MAG: immunity 53 family protein [Parachlamydiales bacterium]|nr:immunity 53 family protein [Parachlamydiales bacterium]
MKIDIINWIQNWYQSQCDGNWEHEFGLTITNTDNPGWDVEINLNETELDSLPFEKIKEDKGDNDWYYCLVRNNNFEGAGDPQKLNKILEVFKEWQEKSKLI